MSPWGAQREFDGDLTLALRILQEHQRGYVFTVPDMVSTALEVERRHVVRQRRRTYQRRRRAWAA